MAKVSVVFPVCNEEDNIEVLYKEVRDACLKADIDYEMIFVDDGSTDNSLDRIKRVGDKDKKAVYVSLSRNFGHQNAIFAGMRRATGDAVISMDADLQHPPSLIPEMVALWRKGAEVVYTVKEDPGLPPVKHFVVKFSYWLISKMSGLRLSFGQSDFRLLDRKVVKALLQIPEYHKFLRGQVSWVGFRQEALSYKVNKRYSGRPKYSYRRLISLALDGIFAFSGYPLHLLTLMGITISIASSMYIVFVFVFAILRYMNVPLPPGLLLPVGWATLAVAVIFLGSVQLIAIGMLGEYVRRIYDQTKGRPVYIIREESSVK